MFKKKYQCSACKNGTNDLRQLDGKIFPLCKSCMNKVCNNILHILEPEENNFKKTDDIIIKSMATGIHKILKTDKEIIEMYGVTQDDE